MPTLVVTFQDCRPLSAVGREMHVSFDFFFSAGVEESYSLDRKIHREGVDLGRLDLGLLSNIPLERLTTGTCLESNICLCWYS